MAQAQESSWESVSGSPESPVWVDGWHHPYQLHLTAVTLGELTIEYRVSGAKPA